MATNRRDIAYSRWKRFKVPIFYEEYWSEVIDVNAKIRVAKTEYFAQGFCFALGSQQKCGAIRDIGIAKAPVVFNLDEMNRNFVNVPEVNIATSFYNFEDKKPYW